MARVWPLSDPQRGVVSLNGHQTALFMVGISPDGRRAATCSADGMIRLWSLDMYEMLQEAGRIAGRNLTQEEWREFFSTEPYRTTFDLPAEVLGP